MPWLRREDCQQHGVGDRARLHSLYNKNKSSLPTAKPVHPDDFPTPDYAAQYPSGRLYAPFCLDMANMPHLQSFR